MILAFAVSMAAPGVALAQTYRELYSECYQGDLPERVIAACSIIIRDRIGDQYDVATAFKNRGNAHDDRGEYELALRDYGDSLAVNPKNADVFNSRGTTRTALGQYEAAIQDFDHALELAPRKAMTLSNRCFVKAVLGQFEDALVDCNEALRLHPNRLSSFDSRGFAYLRMGRADDAIADYNRVLTRRPDDPYALYGRAVAKRMKGLLRESDDDAVHALSVRADIAEHMATIGVRLGGSVERRE